MDHFECMRWQIRGMLGSSFLTGNMEELSDIHATWWYGYSKKEKKKNRQILVIKERYRKTYAYIM